MKSGNIQITVLEPDEGMVLTNGETYSRMVYLGINDSPENWHEVPESEMIEWEQRQMEESMTMEEENG